MADTAYSTMYAAVLNRARQSGTWATDRVKDYINQAIALVVRMPVEWTILEKDSTSTGVVSQVNYALPSDFERMIHVELRSGSSRYRIDGVESDMIREELKNNPGDALPSMYSIIYQQIWFNRTLDAAYTIYIQYQYKPSDLSADGDTTPFPPYIIEEFAHAMLSRDLGRNQEFQDSYKLFRTMLEEYADSDGRSIDELVGFYDGFDGVLPYWDEGKMW